MVCYSRLAIAALGLLGVVVVESISISQRTLLSEQKRKKKIIHLQLLVIRVLDLYIEQMRL
jgi:hypothetical protein